MAAFFHMLFRGLWDKKITTEKKCSRCPLYRVQLRQNWDNETSLHAHINADPSNSRRPI